MSSRLIAPSRSRLTRGAVLIFCIGTLTILAVLAVVFATVAKIERNVSRNYVDLVRARMLATSGVERTVVELQANVADLANSALVAYGEDRNGNGVLDPGEDVNGNGQIEGETCPLTLTPRPSLMADLNRDGRLDARDLLEIAGKRVGVTGLLPGTYASRGDSYAVRARDTSGLLYLNTEGHPRFGQVLENLVEAAGLARSIGTRLFGERQRGPFASFDEVRGRCGLADAEVRTLRQVLTLHGWIDRQVVAPVPLAQRRGSGLAVGRFVATWEEMRPRSIDVPRDARGVVTGRCPVNVNVAPRAVLVALLRDVQGFYVDEQAQWQPVNNARRLLDLHYSFASGDGSLGRIQATRAVSGPQADRVADALIARRAVRRFGGWDDLGAFLRTDLVARGVLDSVQAEALLANFDPNTNLNDFNPDDIRRLRVDKTDLLHWTTELVFTPTGHFEVDSLGRVVAGDGAIVAEAELSVHVKVFDLHRETTQREFLQDFWRDGAPIRDNIVRRERGQGNTAHGLSLATYPEPPRTEWVKEAWYDGYIALATKESAGAGARFRASFSDAADPLRATTGQAQVPDAQGPWFDRLVQTTEGASRPGKVYPDGVYAELDSVPMFEYFPGRSQAWGTTPGDFSVSLWMKPNFRPEAMGRTRVFLTWQLHKPNAEFHMTPFGIYSTATSTDESRSMSFPMQNEHNACNEGPGYHYLPNISPALAHIAQYGEGTGWDPCQIIAGGTANHWQGGALSPCLNHTGHGHDSIQRAGEEWGTLYQAGKWIHLGWRHNAKPFESLQYAYPGCRHQIDAPGEDMEILYVNGKKVAGPLSYRNGDVMAPSLIHWTASEQVLRLGERRDAAHINSVPDATIDEAMVREDGGNLGEEWILGEYEDGRYYAETDASRHGTFTSRAIDLGTQTGAPARIAFVNWTRRLPSSLAADGAVTISLVRAYDRQPIGAATEYVDPEGEEVDLLVASPIRYVVHIRPQPLDAGSPVLESPIFDDITIAYTTGPRFLSWSWVAVAE